MSPTRKRFFRDNLLGISLTLIGLLSAVAITVAYLSYKSYSAPVWADGKALDGPGIDSLQALNRAYERIAQAMTPAIVSIQSTQVGKVQMSSLFLGPFLPAFFWKPVPNSAGATRTRSRERGPGDSRRIHPDQQPCHQKCHVH